MNEKELQAYIEQINKKLKYYYGDAYKRMLNIPEVQKAIKKGTEDFKFSNYTTKKVDKIIAELTQIINTNLQKGITNAWNYGIDNTTNHLSNAFGKLNKNYETEIDKTVLQATKDIRNKTKESYRIVNEKKGGLNISERVWNYNDQIKKEMEIAIQNGIKQGKSADDIARDMQKYLNNPESLFRRVRDIKTDKLNLSKAAKEYHPGQGVYRSAYKNAMRLITTEVNAAYREAEWESYQNNPLIKGYEIRLSNNHTILRNGKRVPFYDICDKMQGVYPKTFKWKGWHPHCRCVMIPILLSEKEFASRVKARKEGKLDEWKADEISEMPNNYKEYFYKKEKLQKYSENRQKYEYYLKNKNYKNVEFDEKSGGLKATHIDHNFDKNKGHYEKEVQNIGFKNGNTVILESEKSYIDFEKKPDGRWNNEIFEMRTSEGSGKNNIKAILNHARAKKAEVVVIYFPKKENFSLKRITKGEMKYNGQTDYRFKKILYIVNGEIVQYK